MTLITKNIANELKEFMTDCIKYSFSFGFNYFSTDDNVDIKVNVEIKKDSVADVGTLMFKPSMQKSYYFDERKTSSIDPSEYADMFMNNNKVPIYHIKIEVNTAFTPVRWSTMLTLRDNFFEDLREYVDLVHLLEGPNRGDAYQYLVCNRDAIDFVSATSFLMTKHKRKYENYIKKTQQKQMINAFILPQLNGELKKLGLGFDESTNKLYMRYGGNNKLPDLFTQAVKQTLITYLKPILDNYDVDFEDNFKHSIAIQRSLGKILFKEIK